MPEISYTNSMSRPLSPDPVNTGVGTGKVLFYYLKTYI